MEKVILVDKKDHQIGEMEKQEAHIKGVLHRAFSIFIFNSKGEVLLQQRAFHKYHSGGLWTNTCCSHPRNGETTIQAANRRLKEEMGMSCALTEEFTFIYKAKLDNLSKTLLISFSVEFANAILIDCFSLIKLFFSFGKNIEPGMVKIDF